MSLEIKIRSYSISLDIKKYLRESSLRLKRAIQAEARVDEDSRRKDAYLNEFTINFISVAK
ncbi:hypothetical protein [Alkaliphilus serpentinus]|uniref:Uncharacterized protein n=1 Tax=Alkaliphilus serpentinus TaxID=1482731 RepID=A0A833HPS6_9FIRM|nr:hypothetical protein [Alkaliphilus serpentinus]KAB3531144.1 hypothetical protein F8153_05795 [Alkaliphilus serpentinus]